MIQTTLFNYFKCNKQPKQSKQKSPSILKQTNLVHYFPRIPKKKNYVLEYFKPKEKENVFDIVLIDIENTNLTDGIKCIKGNMYDPNLEYIAISYRWGEVSEQLLNTPDYTAHITSFHLNDLSYLCQFIKYEPDLKAIPYLWVDAISVNQHNHSRKKDTILKMNEIYKKASYILAVPDLHLAYLRTNTVNKEIMDIILKHSKIITEDIEQSAMNGLKNNSENKHSIIQKIKNNIKGIDHGELKQAYKFLAYLIEDWSNRAWVISEYHIAKEKYKQRKSALKYIFISLLTWELYETKNTPFFSFHFIGQHHENENINDIYYDKVDNGIKFVNYLKSKFMQRSHLHMILSSNATRNEDRFHAILPSWGDYKHLIKDKNTISNWRITNMTSVRLKLYEILNEYDKEKLLYHCSIITGKPILPSFATCYTDMLIVELDAIDEHEDLLIYLSKNEISINEEQEEEEVNDNKEYIKEYHRKHGSIYISNLFRIQFYRKRECYLTINARQIFTFGKRPYLDQEELTSYSLKNDDDGDDLKLIYIPFYTIDISTLSNLFPLDDRSTPILDGVLLLGNKNKNRWILYPSNNCGLYGEPLLIPFEYYRFHIY